MRSKIWDKIKKLFGGKSVSKPGTEKEEPKPEPEPKVEQKPEEQK